MYILGWQIASHVALYIKCRSKSKKKKYWSYWSENGPFWSLIYNLKVNFMPMALLTLQRSRSTTFVFSSSVVACKWRVQSKQRIEIDEYQLKKNVTFDWKLPVLKFNIEGIREFCTNNFTDVLEILVIKCLFFSC